MDYIRRCYVTTIKPWRNSDEEVEIEWYRADQDAKHVTGWSRFRSFSTWNRGDPIPAIGEQNHARNTIYLRGLNIGQFEGKHYEGSADVWENGGIHGVSPTWETDVNGGTLACPWNGPPGPAAVMEKRKGKGRILGISTPTIIRAADDDGNPIQGWNGDFWANVDRWIATVARTGPIAAPASSQNWRLPSARPTVSNIGGAGFSYDTESSREELWIRIQGVAVLWCGWNGLDFNGSHDHLNPEIWDIVHRWINEGGVLIVVNNTLRYDTGDVKVNNALLEEVNAEMEFSHGDGGPYSKITDKGVALEAFSSPGSHPFPYKWASPGAIVPPFSGNTYVVARVPSFGKEYLAVRFPYYTSVGFPRTRITITFKVSRNGGGVVAKYGWYTLSTTTVNVIVERTADLPTTETEFTLTAEPVTLQPNFGFTWAIGFAVEAASGEPTVTIHGLKVTLQGCMYEPCGDGGLFPNAEHPIISPSGGQRLCGVQWQGGSTVVGGRWVACWYPQRRQESCGPGGGQAGGSATQHGTPHLFGSGGAMAGGIALQQSRGVQVGSGGAMAGGDATQWGGGYDVGSGGAMAGGDATQHGTPHLIGSGGAMGGGVAFQAGTPHEVGSGGAMAGGAATQGIGGYDQIATGGAMAGGSGEQVGPIRETGTGGAMAGGTATQRLAGFTETGTGGGMAGGDATQGLSP